MNRFRFLGVNFYKCKYLNTEKFNYFYYPTNDCYLVNFDRGEYYKIISIRPFLRNNRVCLFIDAIHSSASIRWTWTIDSLTRENFSLISKSKFEKYKLLS